MKKRFILSWAIILFILLPIVYADFDLSVEKKYKGEVVIAELKNPIVVELVISNNGASDNAEIYTLVGASMTPKGTFSIPQGVSTVEARAYLGEDFLKQQGLYSFEYQIKGENSGIFKDKLTVRVVSLKDAFLLEPTKFHPDQESINLTIKNNIKAHLENVEMHLSSVFFEYDVKMDFKPFEVVSVSVPISKEKISKLAAGPYIVNGEIKIKGISEKYSGTINYLEKEKLTLTKESSGLLIRRTTVTKTNEGNKPSNVVIEIKKDIISRLFSSYSINPLEINRRGLVVDYSWKQDLKPGESFSIISTTNYTFIVIVLILVALAASLAWFYSMTALKLQKSVSFVRTRGGEFALKIRVRAKARKAISNVRIMDRLPMMSILYEKFGRSPDKIDEKTRQLVWDIAHLNSGEERVFSYIVYSKLRAVGRFELPIASAVFEKEGKRGHVTSNKAYFMSETMNSG